MNSAILSGRIMRHFVRRAITCHQVLQQCSITTTSHAAQLHNSLHEFTDDESMMRDTGMCLLFTDDESMMRDTGMCLLFTDDESMMRDTGLCLLFTDDESMMRDTGMCLLLSVGSITTQLPATYCFGL